MTSPSNSTIKPYITPSGFVVMTAKHAGTCDLCKRPIAAGDVIRYRRWQRSAPDVTHKDCQAVER